MDGGTTPGQRVVVTGGSGRLGRYVLQELESSYDVVNADLVPDQGIGEYIHTDVTDLDAVRQALSGAGLVIHLAGRDLTPGLEEDEYIRVNPIGTWNVLTAAMEASVKRVVVCSSTAATGLGEMRGDWRPVYLPIDEHHPCRPSHGYSLSKSMVETISRGVAYRGGIDVVCLRPMWVVTPEELPQYVAFVETTTAPFLNYYVEVRDLARAFRAAIETPGIRWGLFNITAADSARPEPTLEWYRTRIGSIPRIADPEWFEQDPRASVYSGALARRVLNWMPTTNFLEMRSSIVIPQGAERDSTLVGGYGDFN